MTAAVGCLLAVSAQAAKLDAEAVFEEAAPSVVQLKSVDSEGSGILIHSGGWILTNLHVAASGTPMTVTFSDTSGNVTRKIPGATVFRVHPTHDLAILKLTNPGKLPAVASIATAGQGPKPAATCFTISSPAGIEGALTNTITQGIVSTPRREMEGQELIQFSAAVNPGSSGGALLDQEAKVIGLIVSKQEGGEGVGFAIPLAGMDWKTFVEPAKRTGNRERCERAINLASRARMAGALSMFGNPGGGLPEQLAAAAYYSRLALTEFPADENAFRGMIEVYYLAGKQDICLELARSASRATGAGVFLSLEARSLDLLGKKDEAFQLYSKALIQDNGKASPQAAGNLARMLAEKEKVEWGQVAYLARWGMASRTGDRGTAKDDLAALFDRASTHLPEAAVRAIVSKQSGFTLEEMRGFPAKLPGAPKGDAELLRAFDPAFYQPVLASSAGPLELPAEMTPKSDRDPDKDYLIALPDPVDEFIPASGGRLGLLVSNEFDTVRIFDVTRGDVINTVRCAKGSLAGKWVIGGLDHWGLVDKKQFRIEWFKLLGSGKPEVMEPTSGKLPWDAFAAIMSPYRDDLAWIFLREKDASVSAAIYHFDTGVIRVPDPSAVPKSSLARWASNTNTALRIDAAGTTCAPEVGAELFLTMDPSLFRLKGLGANYVNDVLSFPYSKLPAVSYVDRISAKSWQMGTLKEIWSASGDGWVGTPILTAPVHGSSRVLQVSRGQHLMFKIMDAETGNNVLPICETDHSFPLDAGPSRLAGRRRFAAIAHRSSPRVAIIDFQTGELLSVRMFGWDHLEELPLEIRRKSGQVVRYPLKVPAGSKANLSEYPGNGLSFDHTSNELLISDPEPKQLKPVMNCMVEVLDAAGIKTLFPFKILADSAKVDEH